MRKLTCLMPLAFRPLLAISRPSLGKENPTETRPIVIWVKQDTSAGRYMCGNVIAPGRAFINRGVLDQPQIGVDKASCANFSATRSHGVEPCPRRGVGA